MIKLNKMRKFKMRKCENSQVRKLKMRKFKDLSDLTYRSDLT